MNFLAHIYLSGNNPEVTIGNFIADGIKGKGYNIYPKHIQLGILLHREIDTYTDAHKTVRKSTKRLHKNYGHYSGVIVDILYDHFLAKNWEKYSTTPLVEYIDDFYNLLDRNFEILPLHIQKMIPHMVANNWLLSYATLEGIAKVLVGVNKRTRNRSKMDLAINDLKEFYDAFENEFTVFFEELIVFSKNKLEFLLTK